MDTVKLTVARTVFQCVQSISWPSRSLLHLDKYCLQEGKGTIIMLISNMNQSRQASTIYLQDFEVIRSTILIGK
jgi:hypothetical protein